jgi:hypothetical protein
MHIIMVKSILRRDIKTDKTYKREEAENRLIEIIETSLNGKSDDEKARIMEEFERYFENGGLNKLLNTMTKTETRVRFNSNKKNNRNQNKTKKINVNLNNLMNGNRSNEINGNRSNEINGNRSNEINGNRSISKNGNRSIAKNGKRSIAKNNVLKNNTTTNIRLGISI